MTLPSVDEIATKGKLLGILAVGLTGTAAVGISVLSFPFVLPAVRKICLPYVPATGRQVRNVMQLLRGCHGNMIDLGSGDGRIVIEAAKTGCVSYGVELNPWLVLYSRLKATYYGLHGTARFQYQDIWKTNLRDYDNVVIFGVEEMMHKLETKLLEELKTGGHVIACRYPLPHWKPIKALDAGIDTVWIYTKESS